MKKGSEFDSPLQTAYIHFLKGVLGAKRTTPNWAVLRECGRSLCSFIGSTLLPSFSTLYIAE